VIKLLNTIEHWIFLVFLILLPFQARLILVQPDWMFNEYTAVVLYGSDLLFLFLMVCWALQVRRSKIQFDVISVLVFCFIGFAALSAVMNGNELVSWFRFLKLLEGVLLFLYIRARMFEYKKEQIVMALMIGALTQSILGISQFLLRHDVGLQLLGESVLNTTMRGVASFYSDGEKVIRAYGTTPHPNVLATYLVLAIASYYWLSVTSEQKLRWYWHGAYAGIFFGFLTTFSRVAVTAWVLLAVTGVGVFAYRHIGNHISISRIVRPLFITLAVIGVFLICYGPMVISRLTLPTEDEGMTLRNFYNQQALQSGEGRLNWFGIGIGLFVPWLMEHSPGLLRDLYQPAHNLFLLIFAETGLLGIFSFVAFLGSIVVVFMRKVPLTFQKVYLLGCAAALLLMSGFDHFFWTLQQGIGMWWLAWGVIAGSMKSR